VFNPPRTVEAYLSPLPGLPPSSRLPPCVAYQVKRLAGETKPLRFRAHYTSAGGAELGTELVTDEGWTHLGDVGTGPWWLEALDAAGGPLVAVTYSEGGSAWRLPADRERDASVTTEVVSAVAQNFAGTPLVLSTERPSRARGLWLGADMGTSAAPSMPGGTMNGYVEFQPRPGDGWRRVSVSDFGAAVASYGLQNIAHVGSAARVAPTGVFSVTAYLNTGMAVPFAARVTINNTLCGAGRTLRLLATWELE
jgi:hypothetical protein